VGNQYNKLEKRSRRKKYLQRKKAERRTAMQKR